MSFIDNQTKWYTDKSARFRKIKIEILKCTPEGQYKLAMMRVNALEKCQQVLRMAGSFMVSFGQNINLKPFQEASKALNSISEIILEDENYEVEVSRV